MLLTACTTEGDEASMMDDANNYQSPSGTAITFEGTWTLDDEPLEGTYAVSHFFSDGRPQLSFPTFPYEALVRRAHPEFALAAVKAPAHPPILAFSPAGYSANADYYELDAPPSNAQNAYQTIRFDVVTADGQTTTVGLLLSPWTSTLVVSPAYANCILHVKHIRTWDADGLEHLWIEEPEARLTFTSAKKL